jgi:DNA mismatch repair protein PMS2
MMRALGDASVERLCAEQVITSLSIAVKELLENSLDAGATAIEIRLHNYGTKQIEVVDNGHGIPLDTFKCTQYSDTFVITVIYCSGTLLD